MHQVCCGPFHSGHRQPALQLNKLHGQSPFLSALAHEGHIDEPRSSLVIGFVERGGALDDHQPGNLAGRGSGRPQRGRRPDVDVASRRRAVGVEATRPNTAGWSRRTAR
ncbi:MULTISPECIES: hypothetical protein [unclassified Streptomyces]|uniref:hypothetical protein n=1 Tax=unclassified Streptomyces TaxID=2593676 RepID=UPI0038735F10